MNKKQQVVVFSAALVCFILFALLTVAVLTLDVDSIGPQESSVGLSSLNSKMRDAIPYNAFLYELTELLGLLALASAVVFALLGVIQLIKGRSLKAVDKDIYLLAALYVVTLASYLFFETFVVNYRPVIASGGELEASFPSSHTLLAVTFIGSAMYQTLRRVKRDMVKYSVFSAGGVLMVLTVIGRFLCGVHWFTDILGGLLLGGAILFAYVGACEKIG